MIILNDKRLVLPEPGDIFKTTIETGHGQSLILVRAEDAGDNPDNCSGCVFERICIENNTTSFVCYGPDRYDGVSVKIVPAKVEDLPESES